MQKVGLVVCGLVLAWTAWATLHDLGQTPLQLYDEGTYAQVTGESLARGNFLDFTLGGLPWLEKPPLYFWLAGITTYVTHDQALGIRLPAALFAIAVVFMTMLLAYNATKNYFVAALAGLLLVATGPFMQGAREARFDILIAFFTLLAYWAVFNKKYIWFGVAVALAVLTKSVIAIFAAAALPIVSLWLWDFVWFKDRRFWLGIGLAVVIVAPWHIYEWWQYSGEFWRQYVGYHVLARFESNLFIKSELQTDYMGRLFDYAKPLLGALFLSFVSVPLFIRDINMQSRTQLLAGLSLLALMVVVFFSAQTRALSYLIPLYPFAALFVSLTFYYLVSVYKTRR
ncbi:MAG TPA: glycosyltransferase family 39 protein [Candidatus Paceibacterota bacterium]|jgi:4-amino-4-deoxy-L-arabinose transferase-like glycosyltransferase|nr:glycosyltransferase family 39 protein [Candidatus Paceibacterota bacterium]